MRTDGIFIGIEVDDAAVKSEPDLAKHLDSVCPVDIYKEVGDGGLEIVDTPGVGGLSSVHGAATTGALPSADAVLLVSDAAQEYTAPELEFLRHAVSVCPNVACVITKTDLHRQWRRIADLDREHLRTALPGIAEELQLRPGQLL